VRIVHVPAAGSRVRDLTDLPWFEFDPAIEHRFPDHVEPEALPDADVLVYTTMLIAVGSGSGDDGRRLVETLRAPPAGIGLPLFLLQGTGVFPPGVEELAFDLPGPKVCVGSWLVDLLLQRGVAASQIAHIPNGLNHTTFTIRQPIARRPARVAMNFDPHPVKGGEAGLTALEKLHRALETPAIVFGTREPEQTVPAGMRFVRAPAQATIAHEIYNRSSVYLQPSRQEGFGMCAVEAMACGCALVTTANGGSDDYAVDGETAIVCGTEPDEMAAALQRILKDDTLRSRIATNGARFVERFRWSATAERFHQFAADRLGR
jgi:glycosyltransferase involved in cell wall biosynthesis